MEQTINNYKTDVMDFCEKINADDLKKVCQIILDAYRSKKRIFVAGNGGSAGTANHFCCDFGKNAVHSETDRPKIISLSANMEVVTALGNDFCYGDIFVEQLKNLMEDGDVILLISASGNSENIVRAAKYVKSRNGSVIGFTGFAGGKLHELADIGINVPSDSYEKVEDLHMVLCHIIVCCFKTMNLGGHHDQI